MVQVRPKGYIVSIRNDQPIEETHNDICAIGLAKRVRLGPIGSQVTSHMSHFLSTNERPLFWLIIH